MRLSPFPSLTSPSHLPFLRHEGQSRFSWTDGLLSFQRIICPTEICHWLWLLKIIIYQRLGWNTASELVSFQLPQLVSDRVHPGSRGSETCPTALWWLWNWREGSRLTAWMTESGLILSWWSGIWAKISKANVFLGSINRNVVKIKNNISLEPRRHSLMFVFFFPHRIELSDHMWNIVLYSWCHMLGCSAKPDSGRLGQWMLWKLCQMSEWGVKDEWVLDLVWEWVEML